MESSELNLDQYVEGLKHADHVKEIILLALETTDKEDRAYVAEQFNNHGFFKQMDADFDVGLSNGYSIEQQKEVAFAIWSKLGF